MPYETGGRADKFGNRYESRWVVKQLLRLLNEDISSVVIEAIGEEESGVDLWVVNRDGSRECHQCKARNASKEYWDLSDLASRGIFEKANKQLSVCDTTEYFFISAAAGLMMNDLTLRARNSDNNSENFYIYQIGGAGVEVQKAFKDFCKYMNLKIDTIQGRKRAFEYLKRIYIIQFADDLNTKNSLKDEIKFLFAGDPEATYSLILNYVLENDLLGREITSYMLFRYLGEHPNIVSRQLYKDERIIPRLDYLNKEFVSSFVPVNNSFINRIESLECYEEIKNGNSIIIHGKAGCGKSGCIYELHKLLEQNDIVHLALKLDRRIPEHTSENFGQNLGLPASPVYCLNAISKNKEAVLILDQLDAIRWTNNHSTTALEVCKEIIREVSYINKHRSKKLILVFVCRSFDLQNDRGIKGLFLKEEYTNESVPWKNIAIGEINDEDVKAVTGSTYDNLSKKLQTLLRTPNNLYIWANIEERRKHNNYSSSSDLVKQWWEQLRYNYELVNSYSTQLTELKDNIVSIISKTGKLSVPEQLLGNYSIIAKEYLLSNGLLLSNGNNIGFIHQSFYDYFAMEKMLNQICAGSSIIDVLGQRSEQSPMKRYHLQMLFENLADYDLDKLTAIGYELLNNDIRFYMKYVFLEVLGQIEVVNQKVKVFVIEFLNDKFWRNHIIDAVLLNHPIFIKFLIEDGYFETWLKSEQDRDMALILLRSVNTALQDEITALLYPLTLISYEMDSKIYGTLCWNVDDDSYNMFKLRMELLRKRPQLLNNYFHWEEIQNKPERALLLLELIINNKDNFKMNNHDLDKKAIDKFIEIAMMQPLHIWNTFMPFLAASTLNIDNEYDDKIRFWITEQYTDQIYGRTIVGMIKASALVLIEQSPVEFLQLCKPYYDNTSLIINEILLYGMEALPKEYSDYVICWLIENPHHRFFNFTSENDEYLYSAKMIIIKHSRTCSDAVFKELENAIYYYHEVNELWIAKRRFGFNQENRKSGNQLMAFWPYWGKVQHYLLPALDSCRVSNKTRELIVILQRRFEELEVVHKRNKVTGGVVSSTLGSAAAKIDDKQWLRLIGNRKPYRLWHQRLPSINGTIQESSPMQFAMDLQRIGEKNPSRVANLALSFPDDVDNHYICAVFNIIEKKEPSKDNVDEWIPVSMEVAQQLFKRFYNREDINVAIDFCRAINRRADEKWDNEVLEMISNIAIYHLNPKEGQLNVWSSEDEEGIKVETLHHNSMNCVRGCAAEAIASLLWEDQERYSSFKNTVDAIVNDKHLAVNMAGIECLCPIMNFDRASASNWFFALAEKDLRIIAHPYAYNLFYCLYETHKQLIENTVLQMYMSTYEDVSEVGAMHVANMYLLYGCFGEIIFSKNKSMPQKQGILKVAIELLGRQRFHIESKRIIEFFIDDQDDFSNIYSQILYNKSVSVEEDLDFIIKLVTSNSNRRMMHYFVDFIDENDAPIEGFKDIILGMCQNIVKNTQGESNDIRSELYGIAPELSRLIALLYDKTQGYFEVNQQCLDMWDLMFENRIGTVRELSKSMMDC